MDEFNLDAIYANFRKRDKGYYDTSSLEEGGPREEVSTLRASGEDLPEFDFPQGNTYGDVRINGTKLIRKDVFFEAVQLGRDAAHPVQEWLSEWSPANYRTMSQLVDSLGTLPRELNAVLDFSRVADNCQKNFLREGDEKLVDTLVHREVKWIGENWLGEEKDNENPDKVKSDGAFPLLHNHLGTLKEILDRPIVYYEMFGAELTDRHRRLLLRDGFKDVGAIPELSRPKADCRVIGIASVAALTDPPPSIFYLSMLEKPVGAMLKTHVEGDVVTGVFAHSRGKFCTDRRLRVQAKFKDSGGPDFFGADGRMHDRWVSSYWPYNRKYCVWKRARKGISSTEEDTCYIDNPYSKAYVIVSLLPRMSAPMGTIEWKGAPKLERSKRLEVTRALGVPPGTEPLCFPRTDSDVLVSFKLDRRGTEAHLEVKGPNGTLTLEAPFKGIVPNRACFRGWAVYRKGYLVNPIFSTGPHGLPLASLNHVSYYAWKLCKAVGGFRWEHWYPPDTGDGKRKMWYAPSSGGGVLTTHVGTQFVLCSPYAIVPLTSRVMSINCSLAPGEDSNLINEFFEKRLDESAEELEFG